MPWAHERNSVPDRHLVPVNTPDGDVVIHQVESTEREAYRLKSKSNSHTGMNKFQDFTFLEIDGGLEVSFKYSSLRVYPKRGKHVQKLFLLKPGEVGEFRINYRYGTEGWSYRLNNVKFYYGKDYDSRVFVNLSPSYVVDKTADLF